MCNALNSILNIAHKSKVYLISNLKCLAKYIDLTILWEP